MTGAKIGRRFVKNAPGRIFFEPEEFFFVAGGGGDKPGRDGSRDRRKKSSSVNVKRQAARLSYKKYNFLIMNELFILSFCMCFYK